MKLGFLEYKGTSFYHLVSISQRTSNPSILAFVLDSGEYHFIAVQDNQFTPELEKRINEIKYHKRNVSCYQLNPNFKDWKK